MFNPLGIFVGIDVSKSHLNLALWNVHRSWRFSNNPEGISALTDLLLKHQPALIVLEATGGYEQAAFRCLSASQLSVAIVNPRRVRDFARANGRLATPALAGGAREPEGIAYRHGGNYGSRTAQ